jgi:GT2 family glycosyltransferase
VWGVGGCTLLPGTKKISRDALSAAELNKLETGRGNRFDLDWPRITTWAPGCNMSFRHNKLINVGGFDEAFYGVAIGEEAELCFRIKLAGGTIFYSPAAEVFHLINPTGGCRDAQREAELTAQLLDNAWYYHSRIRTALPFKLGGVLRQCITITFNRASLREWTWPRKMDICWQGIMRAFANRGRTPKLGFLAKAKC